jgi:hypothetical protein
MNTARFVAFTLCNLIAAAAQQPGLSWASETPAEPATFFAGVNLNGPALTIDGYAWHGSDWSGYVSKDNTIEKQDVPLLPETDAERAKMIRSSRWGNSLDIKIVDVPAGVYTVYFYVW